MSCYLTGHLSPSIQRIATYSHAWGATVRLSNGVCICRGTDGYSSRHYHDHHTNLIRVLQGMLDVQIGDRWYRLGPNGTVVVPVGHYHRLVLVEPSVFTEKYENVTGAEIDLRDDIVRQDVGSSEHWRP